MEPITGEVVKEPRTRSRPGVETPGTERCARKREGAGRVGTSGLDHLVSSRQQRLRS